MQRRLWWILSVSLVGSVLTLANLSAFGKEKADDKAAETKAPKPKADKKVAAAGKKSGPRLPRHYSDVISEDQREKATSVYAKFNGKIAKLKVDIETAKAERDKAVEDMLTPEQKEKATKLRDEAKAKRGKTAAN